MKQLIFLLSLLFIQEVAYSQDVEACRKIVNLTIDAINTQSAAQLKAHLSEDFTISGQEGQMAIIVLSQLLSQLEENVKSHEETGLIQTDEQLELKYNIEYGKLGTREGTFTFNEDNKLSALNLFKMKVKSINGESEVIKSNEDIIEIPFEFAGRLIAIDVELNGTMRKFILDSGSPRVILNSRYVIAEQIEQKNISTSKGVGGTISGMDIQTLKTLNMGGIQMVDQEVITLDLKHLEEELNFEFYGLIGYELIKDYDILFDYQAQIITLIMPAAYEAYQKKYFTNNQLISLPFKQEGHLPIVEASINNQKFNFGIDCGAESNLIDEGYYKSLKRQTTKRRKDELIGADNNVKITTKGELKKLMLGDKSFEKLTTAYSDISHLKAAYKLDIDGLIGFQILSKQKTLISYKRKELVFID